MAPVRIASWRICNAGLSFALPPGLNPSSLAKRRNGQSASTCVNLTSGVWPIVDKMLSVIIVFSQASSSFKGDAWISVTLAPRALQFDSSTWLRTRKRVNTLIPNWEKSGLLLNYLLASARRDASATCDIGWTGSGKWWKNDGCWKFGFPGQDSSLLPSVTAKFLSFTF